MVNKYIVAVSAVLNAILLMVLFGIIPFLLYLSIVINIFLIWFAFKTLEASEEARSNAEQILESVELFLEHLEEVYSLEAFYGDQTLKDLIDHSREVINDFVEFQERHYDVEEEQEVYDDDQEEAETSP